MTSCPQQGFIELHDLSLPLSTSTLDTSGLGGVQCPWKVTAPAHQVLNVSVVDFAVPLQQDLWSDFQPEVTQSCRHEIGYVTDGGRNVTLCSGVSRQVLAFASASNSIFISMTRLTPPHALIKFTGKQNLASSMHIY